MMRVGRFAAPLGRSSSFATTAMQGRRPTSAMMMSVPASGALTAQLRCYSSDKPPDGRGEGWDVIARGVKERTDAEGAKSPGSLSGLRNQTPLDDAQNNPTKVKLAVELAEGDVAKERLKVRCLERVVAKGRNLTADEYAVLLGTTDENTADYIREVTTFDPYSKKEAKQELKEAELKLEKAELKLKEAKQEVKEAELKQLANNTLIEDFIDTHVRQRQFLAALQVELTKELGDRKFSLWIEHQEDIKVIVRNTVLRHTTKSVAPPGVDIDHLTNQLFADMEGTACLLDREHDSVCKYISWRWIDGKASRGILRELRTPTDASIKAPSIKAQLSKLASFQGQSAEIRQLRNYLKGLHAAIAELKGTKISAVFCNLGGFSRRPLTNVFSKSRGFGNIISSKTLAINVPPDSESTVGSSSSVVGDRWKLTVDPSSVSTKERSPFYFITSMPRQGKSLLLDSVDASYGYVTCNVYPVTYNSNSPVQKSDQECSTMAIGFWRRVILSIVYCVDKYCSPLPTLHFRPTSDAAEQVHTRMWGGSSPVLAVDEFSKVVVELNGDDKTKKNVYSEITCAYKWCSLMIFSGFSTAADRAFVTASDRPAGCITLKPVTERADFLSLVPLVSSVCSVLDANDMVYFEAIKSSPGLLGYYLEAKDRGGILAETATQVPWGKDIYASKPVLLYLESLHHILLHKNLPECVVVRGIMPSRKDIDTHSNMLGVIATTRGRDDLSSRLEASYLAIQVVRQNTQFVQPHVFPCYILMKHYSVDLGPFLASFWREMNIRVPLLNTALGQSFPPSLSAKQLDTITNFALELRSELLVKAIVCAAQMRCEKSGMKDISSQTSCPLFPVLVPIEATHLEKSAQEWNAISAELKKGGPFKEFKEMVEVAQARLQHTAVVQSALERAKAILKLLQSGTRVIEPSDTSNPGSDLSVFTLVQGGPISNAYHVDLVEVKYGSGNKSELGDLGMKYLMTLLGVLHFVKVFRLVDTKNQFRIVSVRFHVAALVGDTKDETVNLYQTGKLTGENNPAMTNKVVTALRKALLDEFNLSVEAEAWDVERLLDEMGITVDEPAVYKTISELEQLVTPPLLHMLPNVALLGI